MDRTAGFAASVAIREELLQSFIRILYNAGRFSPSLSVSFPTLSANLFMALPELRVSSVGGGHFEIELVSWGPMTVTPPVPPGSPPEFRRVKFRATMHVPPTVTLSAGKIKINFQGAALTLPSFEIDPYSGGAFSAAATAYLNSPEFAAALTQGLRIKFGEIGNSIPEFDARFLGEIATDPSATIASVALDGALAMGIDVAIPPDPDAGLPGVTTHGDRTRLVDVTADYHIGTWTNPRAVRVAYRDAETEIRDTVAENGASLDDFDLRVEEGWIEIAGKASQTGGSVQFSLHAVPQLIRPGIFEEWDDEFGEHFSYSTPDRQELWFDPQDVVVDIDRDWWVVVLEGLVGIITLGIGALVAEAIIAMIRGNIAHQIGEDGPARADRDQQFTIPGVTRPPVRLRIETFECHAEGIFAGITIKPQFWYALLEGPSMVGAEEAFVGSVRFALSLPPDVLISDPELRIAWTVRRTDTNEILVTRDTTAAGGLTLELVNGPIPFLTVQQLSLEVRVYRRLGIGATEIFLKQQYLQVVDYVDRSHPFVRWQHDASVPRVVVESDGTQTLHGYQITHRLSKIHRTAIPGRCRMLRSGSRWRLIPPGSTMPYPDEYFDALPFDLSELVEHRRQVCDYCFFGGPDKDVPLI
jgi:hypothetical protein